MKISSIFIYTAVTCLVGILITQVNFCHWCTQTPQPKTIELVHPLYHLDDTLRDRKQEFLQQHSKEYGYSGRIDDIYVNELADRFNGSIYMDYTGAGVYRDSQLEVSFNELRHNLFGNSHSINPSSLLTSNTIHKVRKEILDFFNASEDEYSVVFTHGATGALKIIADTFPWSDESIFMYLRQNHNSVLGIREVALDRGGQYYRIDDTDLIITPEDVCTPSYLPDPEEPAHLFAYPAEDNFAGVKYPLEWIEAFHNGTFSRRFSEGRGRWFVLLDAAAFVPTNKLDLGVVKPDFVAISFYKLFGFPTGIGALIARNDICTQLRKTYFGGGSVAFVSSEMCFRREMSDISERLEDGTPNFLGIASVSHGLKTLDDLGMDNVWAHVNVLTQHLYSQLANMHHDTGVPLAKIYGRHGAAAANGYGQGSIVNLNLMYNTGDYVRPTDVQEKSALRNIHIRTGCGCNPGACYDYLDLEEQYVIEINIQHERSSCSDPLLDIINGQPQGGCRISIGTYTTFEDVETILRFLREEYLNQAPPEDY